MAMDTLERLFVEELRDMYSAEKQLVGALKKMSKAADNTELREAFESHRKETEVQVERLERVFGTLDLKPRAKKCKGIAGIVEESDAMLEEDATPEVLDAALIAGAQRAEHYEISAYGTLRHWADSLGNTEAVRLLDETLREEKAADEKLNMIAKRVVNPQAKKRA
jgi:ferritin-like metal-binding protein YciE